MRPSRGWGEVSYSAPQNVGETFVSECANIVMRAARRVRLECEQVHVYPNENTTHYILKKNHANINDQRRATVDVR